MPKGGKTPGSTFELARRHDGAIDLLVTDVVMPEMNGRELAEDPHRTWPTLKCLFMSGYTAEMVAHRGILEEGVQFIQKPFSIQNLAVGVRKALEG